MSTFSSFFSSTGGQIPVAFLTLKEMIIDAAAGGYKPKQPKGKEFIHASGAGNMQFIMSNGTENKFIRISGNLHAELLKPDNDVKLEESPVYATVVHEDNDVTKPIIGKFLTVGLSGVILEDVADAKNLFKFKPEPAAK